MCDRIYKAIRAIRIGVWIRVGPLLTETLSQLGKYHTAVDPGYGIKVGSLPTYTLSQLDTEMGD